MLLQFNEDTGRIEMDDDMKKAKRNNDTFKGMYPKLSDLDTIVAINKTKKDVNINIRVTEALTCLEKPTLIFAHNFIGQVVSFPIKNNVINVSSKEIVNANKPAIILAVAL